MFFLRPDRSCKGALRSLAMMHATGWNCDGHYANKLEQTRSMLPNREMGQWTCKLQETGENRRRLDGLLGLDWGNWSE